MPLREIEHGRLEVPAHEREYDRPRTRGECVDGPRPCPFIACEHHLYLDVSARTGAIKLNFPDIEPEGLDQMTETCALDVADWQGATLDAVGDIMNLTRERIRQVEVNALAKVRAAIETRALRDLWPDEGAAGKRRLPIVDQVDDDISDVFDVERFAGVDLDID
jgi:hypothetical protein